MSSHHLTATLVTMKLAIMMLCYNSMHSDSDFNVVRLDISISDVPLTW